MRKKCYVCQKVVNMAQDCRERFSAASFKNYQQTQKRDSSSGPKEIEKVSTITGEAVESDSLVQGLCSLTRTIVRALYDPEVTHSFESDYYGDALNLPAKELQVDLLVSTLALGLVVA
ncbi:hypothetical protein, partial [Streptosporangium nondiastaticum]|uniref:hypothetical protein n=1 Tax=Streptosporangium nondiastaticum TaxID=35764 RepID=UPI00336AEB18